MAVETLAAALTVVALELTVRAAAGIVAGAESVAVAPVVEAAAGAAVAVVAAVDTVAVEEAVVAGIAAVVVVGVGTAAPVKEHVAAAEIAAGSCGTGQGSGCCLVSGRAGILDFEVGIAAATGPMVVGALVTSDCSIPLVAGSTAVVGLGTPDFAGFGETHNHNSIVMAGVPTVGSVPLGVESLGRGTEAGA